MNPSEFLEILHVCERLKDTPRHCTTSSGRTESVAEHSWRVSLMAFLLAEEFPDLDMNRVIRMCLVHDLGECFTGDIPVFRKTDEDRRIEKEKLDEWISVIPGNTGTEMKDLLNEMEEQKTAEARLAKALDKLEAVIQHNESPISTWEDHEYELNRTYAYDVTAFSGWLRELRDVIREETEEKIRQGV